MNKDSNSTLQQQQQQQYILIVLALFSPTRPYLEDPFRNLNIFWKNYIALLMILTCFVMRFLGLNNFY